MPVIPIVHYAADRVPNPYDGGADLPWQVYHTVRNAVVRTCKRHGPTGPMDECPIDWKAETAGDGGGWKIGDNKPIYWVIDDQYNNERYIYLELVKPAAVTDAWLRDLIDALGEHEGWGVGVVSLREGYALVFADRIMVTGPAFAGCATVTGFLEQLRRAVVEA